VRRKVRKSWNDPVNPEARMTESICARMRATSVRPMRWIESGVSAVVVFWRAAYL
jgi:hypothetical protein